MPIHAKFYAGPQRRIDYTPGSAQVVGAIIDLGDIVGVVTSPEGIAANTLGSLATSGDFNVAKAAGGGVTFAQGAKVYWDTVNLTAVAAAGANIIKLGICKKAAVSADSWVVCGINEEFTQ